MADFDPKKYLAKKALQAKAAIPQKASNVGGLLEFMNAAFPGQNPADRAAAESRAREAAGLHSSYLLSLLDPRISREKLEAAEATVPAKQKEIEAERAQYETENPKMAAALSTAGSVAPFLPGLGVGARVLKGVSAAAEGLPVAGRILANTAGRGALGGALGLAQGAYKGSPDLAESAAQGAKAFAFPLISGAQSAYAGTQAPNDYEKWKQFIGGGAQLAGGALLHAPEVQAAVNKVGGVGSLLKGVAGGPMGMLKSAAMKLLSDKVTEPTPSATPAPPEGVPTSAPPKPEAPLATDVKPAGRGAGEVNPRRQLLEGAPEGMSREEYNARVNPRRALTPDQTMPMAPAPLEPTLASPLSRLFKTPEPLSAAERAAVVAKADEMQAALEAERAAKTPVTKVERAPTGQVKITPQEPETLPSGGFKSNPYGDTNPAIRGLNREPGEPPPSLEDLFGPKKPKK